MSVGAGHQAGLCTELARPLLLLGSARWGARIHCSHAERQIGGGRAGQGTHGAPEAAHERRLRASRAIAGLLARAMLLLLVELRRVETPRDRVERNLTRSGASVVAVVCDQRLAQVTAQVSQRPVEGGIVGLVGGGGRHREAAAPSGPDAPHVGAANGGARLEVVVVPVVVLGL